MTTNDFWMEREKILRLRTCGLISFRECNRRLSALDDAMSNDPSSEAGWVVAVIAVGALTLLFVKALWPEAWALWR